MISHSFGWLAKDNGLSLHEAIWDQAGTQTHISCVQSMVVAIHTLWAYHIHPLICACLTFDLSKHTWPDLKPKHFLSKSTVCNSNLHCHFYICIFCASLSALVLNFLCWKSFPSVECWIGPARPGFFALSKVIGKRYKEEWATMVPSIIWRRDSVAWRLEGFGADACPWLPTIFAAYLKVKKNKICVQPSVSCISSPIVQYFNPVF